MRFLKLDGNNILKCEIPQMPMELFYSRPSGHGVLKSFNLLLMNELTIMPLVGQ